jgi:hypothetical protein
VRHIKMFGFALIAAATVGAFVGATSASAVTSLEEVVVCKLDVTTCPSGETYGSGTEIDGELVAGTDSRLLTNVATILCTESETSGTTNSTLAHALIEYVSFENCSFVGSSCFVTVEHLPYLVKVSLKSDHTNYETVVSSSGTGEPKALVNCGSSSLKCYFYHTEIIFTVLLKTNDTGWDIAQELNRAGGSGFLCPSTSTWDAEYLVRCLSPTGTYVNCWPAMEEGSVL